jgi:energy-coupling factor transporter ATP-binding protein EcfA2
MPNSIKYSTTGDTLSLKKGNFFIGVGDVGKGPSNLTGHYQGITPPPSGYTIYVNTTGSQTSIFCANSDAELIRFTNGFSGQNFITATQCLNWYATQTNYVCVNEDYESIITDGLVLNIDAGFTPSYPRSGTTWYDTSLQTNNGTLVSQSQFVNGVTPYFQYSGNNQNVETTVATVELTTGLTQGNTVEQFIWGDGSQVNGNMPFSFYNVAWDIWWLGNTFAFNNGSSLLYGFTGANDLLLNKWCHVVAYFPNNWPSSSGSTKMYINGVERSLSFLAGTFQSRTISQSQTVGIGGGYTDGSDTFNWNGRIALTRIYNRQLSSSEVLNNYQSTFPRFLGKNIVMNGLVQYLDAGYVNSYPTTGTSWTNISGVSGGTGTLTNGPTYSGDGGGSIVFDGTNDYVDCGNILNNPTELTVNFWVKNPNNNVIITKGYRLWEIRFVGDEFGGYVGISTGVLWYSIHESSVIPHGADLTQWNNFTYVYNYSTGNIKFYTNAVQKASINVSNMSSSYSPTYNLTMGRRVESSDAYLSGSLSNVQIYNGTLSPQEIFQNYQAQLPTIVGENFITNGLVLYLDAKYKTSYPGTGTTWNNVSGVSGGTGALTNGPTYDSANGGSIVFDGVDDYVNNGNIPLSSNTFTIEIVFNWDGFNTSTINFLTAGFDEQLEIHTGGASGVNGLRFIPYDFQGSGLQGSIDATNIISSGINHITFTAGYSSPSMAYKNGIFFKSSDTASNVPLSINQTFNIGRRQSNQYFLDGKVYLVKIYNRVLNPSEVLQNFNATKSRFGL